MREEKDAIVLVYTTFASLADAETCGRRLVEMRLAACVNILPAMISLYEWEGALSREEEVVMLVKSRAGLLETMRAELAAMHPYETPALLTIPLTDVNAPYAEWLRRQTQPL